MPLLPPSLSGPGQTIPPRPLARPYAALALARMAEMIGDSDPKVAFPACREVLDRAWGKVEAASRAADEEGKIVVIRETEGV